MSSANAISQKEYLKKYISGDLKKKKKVKKKITGTNIKRSVIVDDDIDLKSMRPLENDEVDLYEMDEDAPQIAGIVDERPPEVKAQEHYSSKRWKVFGGEDGVNIVDSMTQYQQNSSANASKTLNDSDSHSEEGNYLKKSKLDQRDIDRSKLGKDIKNKKSPVTKTYLSSKNKNDRKVSSIRRQLSSDSDTEQPRVEKGIPSHNEKHFDIVPPRKHRKNSSSDPDISPPRRKVKNKHEKDIYDSDVSPPRKYSRQNSPKHDYRYEKRVREKNKNSRSSNSPPRIHKTKNYKYNSDSDNSPPRREIHSNKHNKSDSDTSPAHKKENYRKNVKDLPGRRDRYSQKQVKSDSDTSPPHRTNKYRNKDQSQNKARRRSFTDSDNSPPRRDRKKSRELDRKRRSSRSITPPNKHSSFQSKKIHRDKSPRPSRRNTDGRIGKKHASDSDNSFQRRDKNSKGSDSDLSPPRMNSFGKDRPLKNVLYKPNDNSSSDEGPKSKSKKMNTTLDGKQAGLQDAKQLKKELSDLKMKEDHMFSKMDASVSGVGAAPVKRDRKTGQIRDLEKEKEVQKEKEAKKSIVDEKYYKWGKGIKQSEDAAVRAAEAVKEMNKPLARYVDDKDLDEFLKAQEREGDPMLEYIKRKQSEATPLQGEKPIYKGSWTPNRFNIRPGYRWDGVVRSNGYEQEWFKTKNAKKARDEEAYKWSTSDM